MTKLSFKVWQEFYGPQGNLSISSFLTGIPSSSAPVLSSRTRKDLNSISGRRTIAEATSSQNSVKSSVPR